jgi:hypothetical protein
MSTTCKGGRFNYEASSFFLRGVDKEEGLVKVRVYGYARGGRGVYG